MKTDVLGLDEFDQAKKIIYSTDLTAVVRRLVDVDKWSRCDALEGINQYRNYLSLRRKYPQYELPPSKDIDDVWHAHVLHTQDYREFCQLAFSNEKNQFLDHHPHLAKEGSTARLGQLFEQTQNLYRQEFGEYIYQIRGRSFIRKVLHRIRGYLVLRFPKMADALGK